MLLAIIATLSFAEAHPARHPSHAAVHVETEVRHITHWVGAHYDRHGRWVPGHWVTVPRVIREICRIGKGGRTWCTTI